MSARKPKIDVYAEITNRFIEALKSGAVPWVRPWAQTGSNPMPHNPHTGTEYRGSNIFLLWMTMEARGYSDSRWCTFKQMVAQGYCLKPGQNQVNGKGGTRIVFWYPVVKRNDAGKPTDEIAYLKPRFYTVFNFEQMDGVPAITEIAAIDPAVGFAKASTVIEASGADVRHGGDCAFYTPPEDFIQLPAPGAFTAVSDYWSTALHELVHWTGHRNRLDRGIGHLFGSPEYAKEELIAEMGSAFLCAKLRVEGKLQHVEYIAHWIAVLESDTKFLLRAASKAGKAADWLVKKAEAAEKVIELAAVGHAA